MMETLMRRRRQRQTPPTTMMEEDTATAISPAPQIDSLTSADAADDVDDAMRRANAGVVDESTTPASLLAQAFATTSPSFSSALLNDFSSSIDAEGGSTPLRGRRLHLPNASSTLFKRRNSFDENGGEQIPIAAAAADDVDDDAEAALGERLSARIVAAGRSASYSGLAFFGLRTKRETHILRFRFCQITPLQAVHSFSLPRRAEW